MARRYPWQRERTPGHGRRALALFALLATWAATTAAAAADLQVNPIMVEFLPEEQVQAVWLTNSGTAPLKAQVRVAAWHQSGGEDRLEATRELVASPAILEIAAGEQQLVRLVRPGARPPARRPTG